MHLSFDDIESMTDDEMVEYCKVHGNNIETYNNFRLLIRKRNEFSDHVSLEEIQVKDSEGNYVTLNDFVIESIAPLKATYSRKYLEYRGRSTYTNLTRLYLDDGYIVLKDAPNLTFDEVESCYVETEVSQE